MAVGIDFGTTNCAVVYNRNQLLDESDERPLPSLVAIDPLTGNTLVGHEARKKRHDLARGSWHVVSSVKLALSHDRAIAERQGSKLNSTDISAILFTSLHDRAERLFGAGKAAEAVVSIPVGLRAGARRRLRAAAERAAVKVLEFVSEPTAAFLACRDQLPDSERVLVFDWGGGTLDVSVLQIEDGAVHELATASLLQAGDAIDELIAGHIHNAVTGEDLDRARIPAKQYDRLLVEAEAVKCRLSDAEEAPIFLLAYQGRDHTFKLDRTTLEVITRRIVEQCVTVVRDAITAARKVGGDAKLDHVVLVGGSSRLWGIGAKLRQAFADVDVFVPRRPQWAVAQGASMLAEELCGAHTEPLYRLNHPVYLQLSDGSLLPLVRAGDRFDDTYRRYLLGVVEDTDHAQLIFAVPGGHGQGIVGSVPETRPVDFLSVPLQGLRFEQLRLEAKLTRELTLAVRAQTEKADPYRSDQWTAWEFEQLLFSYGLSDARRRVK
ncbi:MAG TPA: Hsp70 family protein [Tepidisphaeraceae bacterium]|jgi:molecular chaperone DnaK